jgi:hypothetical protein
MQNLKILLKNAAKEFNYFTKEKVVSIVFSLKPGLRNPRVIIARNRDFLVKTKPKVTQYKCERWASLMF